MVLPLKCYNLVIMHNIKPLYTCYIPTFNVLHRFMNKGTLYTLDLFMCIKNNATWKAVKTIILTFRLASSNHYQLGCDDQLIS